MRKLFLLFLISVYASVSFSKVADDYFFNEMNSAKSFYDQGAYAEAKEVYQALLDTGVQTAQLYYNIGNVYFRLNESSNAVLNYEKALKIEPSHEDALHNLKIVNESLRDDFETLPNISLNTLLIKFNDFLSYQFVFVIGVLILLVISVIVFLFKRKSQNFIKLNYWLLLALGVVVLVWSYAQFSAVVNNNEGAVVMNDNVSVNSEPNSLSTLLFKINSGTKVQVLLKDGVWSRVKLPDGNIGWLESKLIEEI